MSKQNKVMILIDNIIPKLKDLVRSKEVLGLLVKTAVHIAFDRKLATETELRAMFEKAIKSYDGKNNSASFEAKIIPTCGVAVSPYSHEGYLEMCKYINYK